MNLKLLRGFNLEVDVVHVGLVLAAVKQTLATRIVDFVRYLSQNGVAADDETVVLASKERQHQFRFVARNEDGAVVVVILDVAIQSGEAIFLRKRPALRVGRCCEQPKGQQEDECMFHCYSTSLLLNAPCADGLNSGSNRLDGGIVRGECRSTTDDE